jgi:hypothetical protein
MLSDEGMGLMREAVIFDSKQQALRVWAFDKRGKEELV